MSTQYRILENTSQIRKAQQQNAKDIEHEHYLASRQAASFATLASSLSIESDMNLSSGSMPVKSPQIDHEVLRWREEISMEINAIKREIAGTTQTLDNLTSDFETVVVALTADDTEIEQTIDSVAATRGAVNFQGQVNNINEDIDTKLAILQQSLSITKTVSGWASLLPFIGPAFRQVASTAAQAAETAAFVATLKQKIPITEIAKYTQVMINELTELAADAKRNKELDSDVKNQAAYITRVGEEFAVNLSAAHEIALLDDEALSKAEHYAPKFYYLLSPLGGATQSRAEIDKYLARKGYQSPDELINSSNVVAGHGYVLIRYLVSIDPTTKDQTALQFVFSTGYFNRSTGEYAKDAILGSLFKDSLAAYNVEVITKAGNSDTWVTTHKLKTSGGQIDLENSRLVTKGPCNIASDLIFQFLDLFVKYDKTPYNLFTHNCQVQSKAVIRYIINGDKPHWWNNHCAARMLSATLRTLTIPSITGGADFVVPRKGYPQNKAGVNVTLDTVLDTVVTAADTASADPSVNYDAIAEATLPPLVINNVGIDAPPPQNYYSGIIFNPLFKPF
jgi:hypothetical protein